MSSSVAALGCAARGRRRDHRGRDYHLSAVVRVVVPRMPQDDRQQRSGGVHFVRRLGDAVDDLVAEELDRADVILRGGRDGRGLDADQCRTAARPRCKVAPEAFANPRVITKPHAVAADDGAVDAMSPARFGSARKGSDSAVPRCSMCQPSYSPPPMPKKVVNDDVGRAAAACLAISLPHC